MFSKVYIAGCALVYGGVGLACLLWPVELLAPVGVTAPDAVGIIELRAMYGGMELGMAGFLGWCLATRQLRAGVVAAWLSIGGLGLVRGGAWLLAGMPSSLHPWLLLAEGAVLLLGPLALRTLRESGDATPSSV